MSLVPLAIPERGTVRALPESAALPAAGSAASRPNAGPLALIRDRMGALAGRSVALGWRLMRTLAAAPGGREIASAGPSTSLGFLLRSLTGDPATAFDPPWVFARLRPMVEATVRQRDERGASDGVARDIAAARALLADDMVVGVLELVRQQAAIARRIAPLTVVALGGYGQHQLDCDGPLELLILVPDQACKRAAAEGMARQLGDGLRRLGFTVANSIAAPRECVAFVLGEPRALASLRDARFLAGAYAPWARLQAQLDAALSGGARSGRSR